MTRKILIAIIGFSVGFVAVFAVPDRPDDSGASAPQQFHYFAIA